MSSRNNAHRQPSGVRAFSLIELMVVIAVIAILLGLLMPGLQEIRHTTSRMLSASNQRTLGQGLTMWAGPRRGRLPESRVLNQANPDLGELMRTFAPLTDEELSAGAGLTRYAQSRLAQRKFKDRSRWSTIQSGWDGLGHLYQGGLVPEPAVYYCPAHWGDHPFERYEDDWGESRYAREPDRVIYGNYHYVGHLDGKRRIDLDDDPRRILITDGLRRQSDLNHRYGTNVLRADGSVEWLKMPQLLPMLPTESSNGELILPRNDVIRDVFRGNQPGTNADG